MFKIQRSDGLFSTGGESPSFTKTGKVWSKRGHVTSHLNLVSSRVYVDCVIIEYEMTPKEQWDASEWKYAADQRKADKEAEKKDRYDAWQREQRRKQYLSLKREFG